MTDLHAELYAKLAPEIKKILEPGNPFFFNPGDSDVFECIGKLLRYVRVQDAEITRLLDLIVGMGGNSEASPTRASQGTNRVMGVLRSYVSGMCDTEDRHISLIHVLEAIIHEVRSDD